MYNCTIGLCIQNIHVGTTASRKKNHRFLQKIISKISLRKQYYIKNTLGKQRNANNGSKENHQQIEETQRVSVYAIYRPQVFFFLFRREKKENKSYNTTRFLLPLAFNSLQLWRIRLRRLLITLFRLSFCLVFIFTPAQNPFACVYVYARTCV